MSRADDSAFPIHGINERGWQIQPGLDKREYFAGLAMQGMLANDAWLDGVDIVAKEQNVKTAEQLLACSAVKFADALLAELEKETK